MCQSDNLNRRVILGGGIATPINHLPVMILRQNIAAPVGHVTRQIVSIKKSIGAMKHLHSRLVTDLVEGRCVRGRVAEEVYRAPSFGQTCAKPMVIKRFTSVYSIFIVGDVLVPIGGRCGKLLGPT